MPQPMRLEAKAKNEFYRQAGQSFEQLITKYPLSTFAKDAKEKSHRSSVERKFPRLR